MTAQQVLAVIGANFGDEGKGLAVDYFCSTSENSLVIRHNGGAQAGHTVEIQEKRFVFHQLSSGSFRRADTYLAETFLPDLYKLEEEMTSFNQLAGFTPKIYADIRARITIIDDILVNMALETKRGKDRHGSCGMGINEAVQRSSSGYGIPVGTLMGMSAEKLTCQLRQIRQEYIFPRLELLGLTNTGEYAELLRSDNVLRNAAEGILKGTEYLSPSDGLQTLAADRENIIFEGAQGLLLDSENERFAPHVTASRTGLTNPLAICQHSGLQLNEAVYVLRSYVTRHGAGPLPFACNPAELGELGTDRTNQENPWQGHIRYGFYASPKQLAKTICEDAASWQGRSSLFITHLNETKGMVKFHDSDIPAMLLPSNSSFNGKLNALYCSYSPFSSNTKKYSL